MAETSRFWTTNDVGDGPAAGYEQDLFADFLVGVFTDGVLRQVGQDLTVSGTSSPITLELGAALVGGRYYQNTTLLQLAVTTPTLGNTAFNVILVADWALQTVRAAVKMADDGNSTPPAIIDTWGTRVELLVVNGIVDVAGNVITYYTNKMWATYSSYMPEGIVTTTKLATQAVTTDKIEGGAVTLGKIAAGAVSEHKIQNEAVSTAKLKDGAITNQKIGPGGLDVHSDDISDGQVLRTNLGYGAPRIYAHQGNSANDWSFPGSNNYTNPFMEMQCGSIAFDFAGALDIAFNVTYPRAYIHGIPLGFLTVHTTYVFGYDFQYTFEATYESYATIRLVRSSKDPSFAGILYWMVMGGAIQI